MAFCRSLYFTYAFSPLSSYPQSGYKTDQFDMYNHKALIRLTVANRQTPSKHFAYLSTANIQQQCSDL